MAIIQTLTTSFKANLLQAGVNFNAPGTAYKLALYTSLASLDANTTAYTTAGEAVGAGYPAGGLALVNQGVFQNIGSSPTSGTSWTDFADLTFPNVTITARGALIYAAGSPFNSVAILDFGADKTSSAGDFTIIFPVPGATTAIIRIS